jgi:hypothetical protein
MGDGRVLCLLDGLSKTFTEGNVMLYRMFSVATLASAMFVLAPALASAEATEATHDGMVVSITNDKLVMTGKDGKEHSHTLAAFAKVICDGKPCQASDLKPGLKIRVTTTKDDPKVATEVEAIDKNLLFANTHDGKVVSITGDKLVMASKQGQEHSHMLAEDAKVTCDGKPCKASDLKAGMAIRVTTHKNDKNMATRVEAIEKDADFAQI